MGFWECMDFLNKKLNALIEQHFERVSETERAPAEQIEEDKPISQKPITKKFSYKRKSLDALVEQRIAERYADKEQKFKETEVILTERLAKSREYRIMLQDYREKLVAQKAELDKKEKNLTASVVEKELKLKSDREQFKEYIKALRRTEMTIMDWLKRKEKQDVEVFDEIMEDVTKLQKYLSSGEKLMDGFQFEEYVAGLLKKNGFKDVSVTPKSNDFGCDILAEKNSIKYVFQCKYYKSPVGVASVQEVFSSKMHYGAHVGVVVTNNVFTKAAKILAKETNILLWDCEKISEMETIDQKNDI